MLFFKIAYENGMNVLFFLRFFMWRFCINVVDDYFEGRVLPVFSKLSAKMLIFFTSFV